MKNVFLIFILLFCAFSLQAKGLDSTSVFLLEKAIKEVEHNKIEAANKLFEEALSFQKTNAKKADLLLKVGNIYRLRFFYTESEKFLKRALLIADKNQTVFGDIENEIGLIYFDQQSYSKALKEFSSSLVTFVRIKDDYGLAIAYNNIGNIFKETRNYEAALQYYEKGLKYANKLNLNKIQSIIYTNIGTVYYHQKNYTKSLEYNKKALAIEQKDANITNLAILQVNIGLCYMDLKNYSKAKSYLEESLTNYEKCSNLEGIYMCYVNLFYTHFLLKDAVKAKFYKEKALDIRFKDGSLKVKIDLYSYLKEEALAHKDTENALEYSLKLLKLNDQLVEEIQNEEIERLKADVNFTNVSNELKETQTSLESETKEKQKMKVLNQKLKRQNQINIFLSLLGLALFIGIVWILIRSNNNKRKANEVLDFQKKLVEDKNTEILNSMEFANSMEKMLLQQMNPHFLYNALTTIEASISIGDLDFTKKYLNLFSDLLRKTLDNSRKDVISLVEEIEFLKAYIALNAVKQGNEFRATFEYEQDDIEDFVLTPPMLVQPFIENALIHGLYHKTNGPKQLTIRVEPKSDYIIWTITDNGIGREKAKEIGKSHKGISHGIKITFDRIFWMKKRYGNNFSIHYEDLEEGTRVILKTPILD
jgi:tetratricopeptide (TPR) repeat protein